MKSLQPEHVHAARRRVREGAATHSAESYDDRVVDHGRTEFLGISNRAWYDVPTR